MRSIRRIAAPLLLAGAIPFLACDDSSTEPGKVSNQPPTVVITSPDDGLQVFLGTAIGLVGSGNDFEDGSLAGQSLEWISNFDGLLGTGEKVTALLSGGRHTVTLIAIDSRGARQTARVLVEVRDGEYGYKRFVSSAMGDDSNNGSQDMSTPVEELTEAAV